MALTSQQLAAIKSDIGVIKDDLGVFVRNLEAKG